MHVRAVFLGCGCTNGKPFVKLALPVSGYRLANRAKSAVEGFVADGGQCLIFWRAISSQRRLPIGEGEDRASLVGSLFLDNFGVQVS
jgi:hypothetical protein